MTKHPTNLSQRRDLRDDQQERRGAGEKEAVVQRGGGEAGEGALVRRRAHEAERLVRLAPQPEEGHEARQVELSHPSGVCGAEFVKPTDGVRLDGFRGPRGLLLVLFLVIVSSLESSVGFCVVLCLGGLLRVRS